MNDLICRQTIEEWKNLKPHDGFLYLNDYPIGILCSQLPKHGIYGTFYEPNLMSYFPLILELRKANQDIFESVP